jgi:23S rRNA pseudouridine955/2504/2580 synthase
MGKKLRFKDIILFETDDYLVINKPGDVASLHERDVNRKSIVEMAKAYNENAGLCHRLDKETSGALLIAKNEDAYKNAAIQFEKRLIKKEYHAVCDGYLSFEDFDVDLPIYASGAERVRIDRTKGKPSKTIFNTLKNYGHFSLLSCSPVSGRMHQIRIHLASQNALISGDLLYGGTFPLLSKLKRKYNKPKYEADENPIFKRVALHSYSITFTDLQGKEVKVEAPYPKDLEVFIKILDKYDKKDIHSSY